MPTLQRAGLRTLTLGYRLGVSLRNWAFDHGWKTIHQADVPVVSVGNLTVGGTGKTPCVEFVARFYRQLDLQVTLLSRGYGSEAGRNDEALVLEENLPDVPHLQGADRAALAKTAVEELESEILVLDDGFQHRHLRRDLDIVLIDATCPWGYGHLLPRGLLREPIGSLKRAQVVILTRCDLATRETIEGIRATVAKIKPELPIAESIHQPAEWRNASRVMAPLEALKDRPIAGFCGLGNPEAFRQTLLKLGLNVIAWRTFPDHHGYTREDVEDLRVWARQLPAEAAVVTTQKDLVKIRLDRLGDRELWALAIRLKITSGQDAFEEVLRKIAVFV
ncbi:MAG: tetraacyldisaccharide 4'-kinase [Gemmataceae bacterium]|nr:tetraacyldisaccharide 4'-kinase [Gemmataceae bacterium]